MSAYPIVISFYTMNTLYQLDIQNLIASCEKFNLEKEIEGVESFGSWELNCAYKPFFIYQKLQELKRSVLWVDADGVFVRRPEYLNVFNADFSVRINQNIPNEHPSKVMSGAVYVNYTDQGIALVLKWAQESARQLMQKNRKEEFWDQMALRDVLLANACSAKIEGLPHSYTKVVGNLHDQAAIPDPVIEHYQASRRNKKSINDSRLS